MDDASVIKRCDRRRSELSDAHSTWNKTPPVHQYKVIASVTPLNLPAAAAQRFG